jgi:integrase
LPTKKEAEKRLTELLRAIDTGLWADPQKMTLGQYLDYWYENYCKINLAPSTLRGYSNIINNHLKPALGAIRIDKLMPSHIQSYYTDALTCGRKRKLKQEKPGLSPTYVLYHHRVLREALEHAVQWQLIYRNPADACKPPEKEKYNAQVFTKEQIDLLLTDLKGSYLYMPTFLAIATGMRQAEILALTWDCVNLDEGLIFVIRKLERFKKGEQPRYGEPKTAGSKKKVYLFKEAIEELKRHKEEQEQNRLAAKELLQDNNLVCCYADGSHISPATFSRAFRDRTRKLGISSRFHDLRHSVATILLEKGVHPKVAAEFLRQGTTILLDTYSHVTDSLGKEAAKLIGQYLKG